MNMWIYLAVISLLILFFYLYLTHKFNYWKKKNVCFAQPVPLFGNYKDYLLQKLPLGKVISNIYKQFPDEPYVGVFYGTEPTLLVQDPEILKIILVKDFYYFNGREVTKYADREPVTKSFFFTGGDDWKIVRQNLSPLYSTAKMKSMFPLIEKCSQDFEKLLEYKTRVSKVIETNSLMQRFTVHCVASAGFGITTDVMENHVGKDNQFIRMADLIFKPTTFSGVKFAVRAIWPKLFYALGLQIFHKDLTHCLASLVINVIEQRQNKPSPRNDFVDSMLVMKQGKYIVGDSKTQSRTDNSKKISVAVDNAFIVGQVAAFYGAANDTSVSTLTLTLLELAKHQDVQRRLQNEIEEYLFKNNNVVRYNCVTDIPYLVACVDETLRLHPIFQAFTREVMEDYTLPTGLHLNKGVRIHIPVDYIQHKPENFPDPYVYRPERFLPEERRNIMPFTYLPFGEGPRNCIGMRFAKMLIYTGLITVLKDYNIELVEGKAPSTDFDPRCINGHTISDINLKYEPRSNIKSD